MCEWLATGRLLNGTNCEAKIRLQPLEKAIYLFIYLGGHPTFLVWKNGLFSCFVKNSLK